MQMLTDKKILQVIDEIEEIAYSQCYYDSEQDEDVAAEPIVKSDRVLKRKEVASTLKIDLVYNMTLDLLLKLFSPSSIHVQNFKSQLSLHVVNTSAMSFREVLEVSLAKLAFIRSEINFGLLNSIRDEVAGEVVTDFVELAKHTLQTNKDIAAVLACASLEDLLKRIAIRHSLDVAGKGMQEMVNALKGMGVIKSTEGDILKNYVQLRNRTFHADWSKIESTEVSGLIGFTEQMIVKYL